MKENIKEIIKLLRSIPEVKECGKLHIPTRDWPLICFEDLGACDIKYPDLDLFDKCSDDVAKKLLRYYIKNSKLFYDEFENHLAHLLAKRGNLIRDEIEPIIRDINWISHAPPYKFLSFIVNLPDFHQLLDKLLSIINEDSRDGLFIACMDSDDPMTLEILYKHFMIWVNSGKWTGTGSGELGWLYQFLCKFVNHFPSEKLLPLMEHYFKNV